MHDPGRSAAAAAGRLVGRQSAELPRSRFDVQARMGFALGGKHHAMIPNDLLKDGNAERSPKPLPLLRGQERILSLEQIGRTRQDNQGMGQRRNRIREQRLHLRPCSGDRRRLIGRRLSVPSAIEHPDTFLGSKPGHQNRRGRSGRDRVDKPGLGTAQTEYDLHLDDVF